MLFDITKLILILLTNKLLDTFGFIWFYLRIKQLRLIEIEGVILLIKELNFRVIQLVNTVENDREYILENVSLNKNVGLWNLLINKSGVNIVKSGMHFAEPRLINRIRVPTITTPSPVVEKLHPMLEMLTIPETLLTNYVELVFIPTV